MNGKIFNGDKSQDLNAKLTDVLKVIFAPASAKASVSGEDRGLAASALLAHLPALGKFTHITLTDDEGTITVKANGIGDALQNVINAFRTMEAIRAELEPAENLYRAVRSFVASNPATGKRGRKGIDLASKYSLG